VTPGTKVRVVNGLPAGTALVLIAFLIFIAVVVLLLHLLLLLCSLLKDVHMQSDGSKGKCGHQRHVRRRHL
jgi:hypothetical protein